MRILFVERFLASCHNVSVRLLLFLLQLSLAPSSPVRALVRVRKISNLLGGEVRYMITGSAPIDAKVLELLKVAFCCPFMEGYGLTETSGGSAVTLPNDPVTGHVGGPLPCVKWRLKDVPEMGYTAQD